jgi:CheY-like chemotaxis protein
MVEANTTSPTVLVVDDEVFNLEILSEHLSDEGYNVVSAEDGAKAWALLEEAPERFDTVLLDRMMPHMNGMEVLERIKGHPQLNMLPVVMQTAKAASQDVLEGLQAGAYYYLTKPFDKETMLAIVKTAVADYKTYLTLQQEAAKTAHTLSLMNQGQFALRTLDEARDLAALLANAGPQGGKAVLGLSELLINAVEHGNLGITYEDKSKLNEEGTWEAEVLRRLALPENADKRVTVSFECEEDEMRFLISDQGKGFDWESYLEISPERAFDNHGRGIAMARMVSFDRLEYLGNGSQVLAAISLKES